VIILGGFAGVISKDGSDVVDLVLRMLSKMERKGQSGCSLVVGRSVQRGLTLNDLSLGLKRDLAMGHVGMITVREPQDQQPFEGCRRELVLLHTGAIYNYKSIRERLRDHEFSTETDSETLVHLVGNFYSGDLASSVAKALEHLDGEYALAVTNGEEIVVACDAAGVKQLYIGENDRYVAFASELRALGEIGIEGKRLLPGHVAKLTRNGVASMRVLALPLDEEVTVYDLSEAIKRYSEALVRAVKKRVEGFNRIGVIFSAGVDSTLIAKIASEFTKVICYTAGLKNSRDIRYARYAAEKLGLKVRIRKLTPEDIERYVPRVIEVIENRLFNQLEAGIPVYAAVEMAREDGVKVILSGQGADELFGGYESYRDVVRREGYEAFRRKQIKHIRNIYRETLERENKIAMALGLEIRYPYLDPEVVRVAMQIDSKLKIRSADDTLQKYVHRETARALGIPEELAYRPKDAAQFSSGVFDVLSKLVEKYNLIVVKKED